MRKPPSPGQPMLLSATVRCDCGWVGLDCDLAGALLLWREHARDRVGHELKSTSEE